MVSRGGGWEAFAQLYQRKIDGSLHGNLRVYIETVGLSQHILLHENLIPKTISPITETSSTTDTCMRALPIDQNEQQSEA